jgi:hypothetical protein
MLVLYTICESSQMLQSLGQSATPVKVTLWPFKNRNGNSRNGPL